MPTSLPSCCAGPSPRSSARPANRSISGFRRGRSTSRSAKMTPGPRRGDRGRRLLAARAGGRRRAGDRLLRRRRPRGAGGASERDRGRPRGRAPRDHLARSPAPRLARARARGETAPPSGSSPGCARVPPSSRSATSIRRPVLARRRRRQSRSCRWASTVLASRATSPTSTVPTASTPRRSSTPPHRPVSWR